MSGSLPQSLLSTGTLSLSGQSTEAGDTRPHCTVVHSVHSGHHLSQDSFTLFQLKGSKVIIIFLIEMAKYMDMKEFKVLMRAFKQCKFYYGKKEILRQKNVKGLLS